MNRITCPFESETREAVRSDRWPEPLEEHMTTCEVCQETRIATTALHLVRSQADTTDHVFPRHQLLWIRAQFVRKEEKLSALDLFTLAGVILLAASGFIGFVFWRWPQIKQVLGIETTLIPPRLVDVLPVGPPLFVFIAVIGIVLLMTMDYFATEK